MCIVEPCQRKKLLCGRELSYLILSVCPRNMTLSGFKDSVMELVHFVGRLATISLQLEGCHSLLFNFILDFYETVNELMLEIESAL